MLLVICYRMARLILAMCQFYERLVNKITDANDKAMLIHSAKHFYKLYGDIFREIEARTMH